MYPAVSAVYRRRPADGSTLLLLTYVYVHFNESSIPFQSTKILILVQSNDVL